mmetsp:Transcript_26577/g.34464  ORF Transcript_26577/g.34464 Transcript_26577/m.34464 type:complete len:84 (-) Transcript_26577:87-338(-)
MVRANLHCEELITFRFTKEKMGFYWIAEARKVQRMQKSSAYLDAKSRKLLLGSEMEEWPLHFDARNPKATLAVIVMIFGILMS